MKTSAEKFTTKFYWCSSCRKLLKIIFFACIFIVSSLRNVRHTSAIQDILCIFRAPPVIKSHCRYARAILNDCVAWNTFVLIDRRRRRRRRHVLRRACPSSGAFRRVTIAGRAVSDGIWPARFVEWRGGCYRFHARPSRSIDSATTGACTRRRMHHDAGGAGTGRFVPAACLPPRAERVGRPTRVGRPPGGAACGAGCYQIFSVAVRTTAAASELFPSVRITPPPLPPPCIPPPM